MAVQSSADMIRQMQQHSILPADRLEQIRRAVAQNAPQPKALAKELLRRGWLTRYQAEEVLRGRAASLLLGQYVLLEKLGEGGMGTVYKARHQRLDRVVALKCIRGELLGSPGAVERFEREVRAAARLSHDHIVTIHDADEVAGVHFYVMEYLEGVDLDRLISRDGPLAVELACEYIRQAALALQHLHEAGLVHRDVKLQNLLLHSGTNRIKLLDLGLVRLESPVPASKALTRFGACMGTPDYMPPEQAEDSHAVDIRKRKETKRRQPPMQIER